MIVALMQPYLFPYIGYFQLMHAVDLFVFYDDVQYMKGGWINRNLIEVDNNASWLTLPVHQGRLSLRINERQYILGKNAGTIRNKIRSAYGKCEAFEEVYADLCESLEFQRANVAEFNANSLTNLSRKLGSKCQFARSSEFGGPPELKGENRVIELCRRVGATQYVNPIGGTCLYNPEHFHAQGIALSFLQTKIPLTSLRTGPTHLSIIHTLMKHGFKQARTLMGSYQISVAI
jgi:hypothetical protein